MKKSWYGIALLAATGVGLLLTPATSQAQRGAAQGAGYDSGTGQPATQSGAGFVVRLPDPNAEVWFADHKTQQRGTVRRFESAALKPGQPYTFHVRTRWMQDGQPVEQTRDVQAQAGQTVNVDFTAPQKRQTPPAPKPGGD
jgi:uncharacterized protein (TIGR03000 family)